MSTDLQEILQYLHNRQIYIQTNYIYVDLPRQKEKSVIFAIPSPRESVKSQI